MAGFQRKPSTFSTDPILAARLEVIKQLAGGLSERATVMDRNFNVIYPNESVWAEDVAQLSGHQAKCHQDRIRGNRAGESDRVKSGYLGSFFQ